MTTSKVKLPTDKLFAVGTDMAAMYYSMLQEQFFLPADAIEFLEAQGWYICNIQVVTGKQWQNMPGYYKSEGRIQIKYEPSEDIVNAAQYVGYSVRYFTVDPEEVTYIVAKLWFPAIDTSTKDKDND